VVHATGRSLSALQAAAKIELNFEPVLFGLLWEIKDLYRRIDSRCDRMVSGGLLEEAAALDRRGYDVSLNALNTVGYKEAFASIHGEISPVEMLSRVKQNSRRYAKRQMTWFRRDGRIRWIRMNEQTAEGDVAELIARQFCAITSGDEG
jgi:tRNA dimethylallyltransferase